ncbi:MAG: UDP-3-O-(3-hydroxymyristoyl)glucosamine N-acyltransferase [Deltaproteobacteria bacterium]|jgi:UDP-3-O-[3-hydroxymyristoyl] glucosamine N-acyltransferase|nr:UDP-3-O-(3-hydroxymyristoyl)glucosamine N-acyltransferase [Deltaproteobacteria bacterium]
MIPLPEISLGELGQRAKERLAADFAILGGGEAPEIETIGPNTRIAFLSSAEEAGPMALCFATSPDYLAKAQEGRAAAVAVNASLKDKLGDLPALIAPDPRLLFAAILSLARETYIPPLPPGEPYFVDRASCQIGPGVILGPRAYIGARVIIGEKAIIGPDVFLEDDVVVGAETILHPKVIIRWGCQIGQRCQIHAGAVIGEDGFGYTQVPSPQTGRLIHYKNPHLGKVILGDDVEIGALTAIDRGLVADTVIGRGVKMDNLVQIGHNCQIGQDVIVVAQVGCAGHSNVGDRAFLLGQCGLTHGAVVGQDAIITGQSGVTGRVPAGREAWSGTPCRPMSQELRSQAMVNRDLPRWRRFWAEFRKSPTFEALKKALASGD